jgi:hypothetical protein
MKTYPLMRRLLHSDPVVYNAFMELVSEHYRVSNDPPKWDSTGETNRFRDALYEFGQLVLTARHQFQTRSTPQDGTWRVCPNCSGDGRFVDFDLDCVSQWAHDLLNGAL